MPVALVTDWKRVAKSGPTVDGRKIDPQWLMDMAETYNPDEYTAKLWIDHRRYMGSYGAVRAVKAEKDGDVVRLFAKINPNRDLIERNQVWENNLHFSIEVIENFAETGKFYLGGLAMTDEPASLGTDEMRFSTNPQRTFTARYPGDPVPDLRDSAADETALTLFRKLMQMFSKQKTETEIKEEEPTREIFLAKELTKKYQNYFHGCATDILEKLNKNYRGEWVVVLSAGESQADSAVSQKDILELDLPKKTQAKLISKITGENTKACYQRLLEI